MPTKNNKRSILQKLKPNTKKGRILATVVMFAVVGGGVMVYRSFAATITGSWSYGRESLPYKTTQNGSCKAVAATDTIPNGGKNPPTIPVITLSCPKSAGRNSYARMLSSGAALSSDPNSPAAIGRKYDVCVEVKGTGNKSYGLNVNTTLSGDQNLNTKILSGLENRSSYADPFCAAFGGTIINRNGDWTIPLINVWVEVRGTDSGSSADTASYLNVKAVKLVRTN